MPQSSPENASKIRISLRASGVYKDIKVKKKKDERTTKRIEAKKVNLKHNRMIVLIHLFNNFKNNY